MSLISKLFRKSEPDEQEQAEPTPPAATAPHAAPEVGELAQPAQPGDAVPATAPDTAPAPERTNWWDEQPAPADTTPAAEAPAHAEQAAAELPAPNRSTNCPTTRQRALRKSRARARLPPATCHRSP
jgi:hypothetical protein